MSEIKLACPHCRQHIACDENYADLQIACPACRRPMIVPAEAERLAIWKPSATVREMQSSVDTAAPAEQAIDFWSEEKWRKHVGQMTSAGLTGTGDKWFFLVALFTPAFLTLLVLSAGRFLENPWLQEGILFLIFLLTGALARYCGEWLADRFDGGEILAWLFGFGVVFVNGFIVVFGCAT